MSFMTVYVIALFGCISSVSAALPSGCHGSSKVYCTPIIPNMPQISGCNMPKMETIELRNYTGSYSRPWTLPTLSMGMFIQASRLKHIIVDYVGLKYLYSGIFHPVRSTLQTVSMDGNLFKHFPVKAFIGLTRLKEIRMRFQYIKSFVIQTNMQWKAMTKVDLSGNNLQIFDVLDFRNTGSLSIILDYNELVSLNTSDIYDMFYLSAKGNNLVEIDENCFLHSMKSRKHLNLSGNNLDENAWKSIDGLDLESLVFSRNNISLIDSSVINSMKQLRYLDLSENRITSVGDLQLRSGKMNYLFLAGNKLSTFPSSVVSKTNTFQDPWLGIMDLSFNKFHNIDLKVPKCKGKCNIFLVGNDLVNISFDVVQSSLLGILNLSSNSLTALHGTLPKAHHYVLSNNPLNTGSIVRSFSTSLKESLMIEVESVGLFCNDDHNLTWSFDFDNLDMISLKNNCIPLNFICAFNGVRQNDYPGIYIDNTPGPSIESKTSCQTDPSKIIKVISMERSGLNDTIFEYMFLNQTENVFENVEILIFRKNELERLPLKVFYTDKSYYYYNHSSKSYIMDFSENRFHFLGNLTIQCNYGLVMSSIYFNVAKNNITQIGTITISWSEYMYQSNFSNNYIRSIDIQPIVYFSNNLWWTYHYEENKVFIDLSYNKLNNVNQSIIIKSDSKYFRYTDYLYLKVHLNLSHNSMETYLACDEGDDLRIYYIDISYNKISGIPNMECQMAVEMWINDNNITNITKPFPYAVTKILYMDRNLIKNIAENAFRNLSNLETLSLKGNALSEFPIALRDLKLLKYLDLSSNNIESITKFDLSERFPDLEILILSGNSMEALPTYTKDLIHCDCGMLFLRNYTLDVTGRCASPPEVEGFLASCFPVDNCKSFELLYITKQTIDKCRKDIYSDIRLTISKFNGICTVDYRVVGPFTQQSLQMEVYNGNRTVATEIFNHTGRYHKMVVGNLDADVICMTAYFTTRPTIKRCADAVCVDISQRSPIEVSADDSLYVLWGLLGVSVLLHLLTILFILISRRRNKNTIKENTVLKQPTPEDQTTYEDSVREEGVVQYEELTTRRKSKTIKRL